MLQAFGQALKILLALKRNNEHFLGKENQRAGRNDTADSLSNCESIRLEKNPFSLSKLTNRRVDSLGVLRLMEMTALFVVLQDKDIHLVLLNFVFVLRSCVFCAS